MKSSDFGRRCQLLNKEYYALFSTVPCIADYACTQEEFFHALERSIKEKQTIDHYIPAAAEHTDGRLE